MSDDLLWKATRRGGTTRNGVAWAVGDTVTHPTSTAMVRDEPSTYLSLSAEPAETLIGGSWPCRLFRVEPVGEVIGSDNHRHKRCVLAARVVAEVEPWRALGPNGRLVAAVIDRCSRLTADEAREVSVAWAAARGAAWDAARDAARAAARGAAWAAARGAAWDAAGAAAWDAAGAAAWAAVVTGLITGEQYELLTGPLVSVVGPLDQLPVPAWADHTGGDQEGQR